MAKPQAPKASIRRWSAGVWSDADDPIAAEEPLQVLLNGEPLTVLMRTPGSDIELALGLLFAEGIIKSRDEISSVRISAEAQERTEGTRVEASLVESNLVDVRLAGKPHRRPKRSFIASSAYGVCGAEMIEDLRRDLATVSPGPTVDPATLPGLVDRLREGQDVFEQTGGLHAAGLFDAAGSLVHLREDIGRHNAVDKIVGRLLLDAALPASSSLMVVSGRAGYEIIQKSIAAGIPMVASVGAPSSLAIALAREFNQTLLGFLRSGRFNVYSVAERVDGS